MCTVKDNNLPQLYIEKKDCCGCGACLNICPRNAISMVEDDCGYIYPVIDADKCVRCGMCKKVCAFQNVKETNEPIEAYAGVSKDDNLVKKSASGGVFATIAREILSNGGIVFGASMQKDWTVSHVKITKLDDLAQLQGSKYTHSNTGSTFREVKQLLSSGEIVLYSGTPCQIAGLYAYLGKRPENLYTVDLICHGVPSNKMFKDYINTLEKKYSTTIQSFTFRDKSLGWGKNGAIDTGRKRVKIWESASSYLYYFKQGWLYRENYYSCKYTCKNRPADITLGDFWGIEKQHPEYLGKNGFDEAKGLSAIIVNTANGHELIKNCQNNLELQVSTFQKVAEGNHQLREPSKKGKRDEIIESYITGGWNSVNGRFEKIIGWRKYSSQIKSLIPIKVKRLLKGKKR